MEPRRPFFIRWACLSVVATCSIAADSFPLPGKAMKTPVQVSNLDRDAFSEWVHGEDKQINQLRADSTPQWVLWTEAGRTGHSGFTFGTSKSPGARHLRIGFKEAIPVGSILTKGNIRVSVLRADTVYPGKLDLDEDWLPGRRLADGKITSAQTARDEHAVWVFPSGTTTRALRFTHVAAATDANYQGWLGGAIILNERLVNHAPLAQLTSKSNNRHAGKIANGMSDSWGCWENVGMNDPQLANRPAVSQQHPEWVQLTWSQSVGLDGLVALWTGFGAVEIQAHTGPDDVHPRDASDDSWKTVAAHSGFESGYPTVMWPNWFPFEEPVRTRAIRLLVTAVTPVPHPHVRNKTAGGARVWLGEILAVKNIENAPLQAPSPGQMVTENPHPPIPVEFTLPEAGYVTLVIENKDGMRIRNLVSETPFPAGKNTAWWDGTDDLGRDIDAANHGLYNIPNRMVEPGTYKARGLWRKEIEAFYEFSVYTSGDPPWSTPDHTGAWLANHSPPSAAVFVPASHSPTGKPAVFLGCDVTEGPDGLAWVDLDGRKRGGMKWIGGNWTAAPYLGRDTGSNADPQTAAYVASVWETQKKSGVFELRVNALEQAGNNRLNVRQVVKERLSRWSSGDQPSMKKGDRATAVSGIAAWNGVVACSLRHMNKVVLLDHGTGQTVGTSQVRDPRGLVFNREGELLVLSNRRIVQLEIPGKTGDDSSVKIRVADGLEDPIGLAMDMNGNVYVSDWGKSHQVKVFSPDGKLIRTIGHPGEPTAGAYDPLHMNYPAGLAIDSSNQLWVTEHDYLPKRVSVWSLDGKLIRAFYGPAKYGGGGMLDSHDSKRFYYADETNGTLEFCIDWKNGRADLAAVLYRRMPDSTEMPFRSAAPETALYLGERRYFTNCFNTNPTSGHNTGFIFIERDGVLQPAAGMGMANEWSLLKADEFRKFWPNGVDLTADKWKNGGANQALFIWCDSNDDAHIQPGEVSLHQTPARGVTVMDDLSFCIANMGGTTMRFRPSGFSDTGVPRYDYGQGEVLAQEVQGPKSSGGCQVLADDSDEVVVTLGIEPFDEYSISGAKGRKAAWSYPSPWPGLHASHHAAKPDRPGQIIGTTRLLGGFVHPKGSEVGPLWALNGNMGNLYLFTRDGLFVATVFEDVRQGRLWRMSVAERGMSLKGISLHDENFWPSISQTPDGQVYLVDGSNSALVRLDGLDTLKKISQIEIEVTPQHLAASREYVLEKEASRQRAFGSGILKASLREASPTVDGNLNEWANADWVEIDTRGAGANFNSNAKPYNIRGALAASGDRLFAAWDTREPRLLSNSGETPNALFKTGGALDLMLRTDPEADPNRRSPVDGDLRLLITRVKKQTRATLYRQVVKGAAGTEKVPFSSPWRTITFDRVEDISDQVVLADDNQGSFEISIPHSLLGLQPRPGLRHTGDIGILRGNGTETTARSYWSNKATGITADVPSEAMLTPDLWGTIEWE